MTPVLTSPDFEQGGTIPRRFTCEGENRSPAFASHRLPARTRSLLPVSEDRHAPGGVFRRRAACDMPAERTGLDTGCGPESLGPGCRQAMNDCGKPGCGGPCPPRGDRPPACHVRMSALSEPIVPAASSARSVKIRQSAAPAQITFAALIGPFGR